MIKNKSNKSKKVVQEAIAKAQRDSPESWREVLGVLGRFIMVVEPGIRMGIGAGSGGSAATQATQLEIQEKLKGVVKK